jgi:lactoylglutathione lyase
VEDDLMETAAYGRDAIPSGVRELRLAVTAADWEAAVGFYRDELGLPQLDDFSSDRGRVVLLDAGRATLELLDGDQAAFIDQVEVGRRVAGPIRVALQVADVDATFRRLAGAGGEVIAAPTRTPWNSLNARLRAPAGLQLTLFEELVDTDPTEPG